MSVFLLAQGKDELADDEVGVSLHAGGFRQGDKPSHCSPQFPEILAPSIIILSDFIQYACLLSVVILIDPNEVDLRHSLFINKVFCE